MITVERRVAATGRVIERCGPYQEDDPDLLRAIQFQMHIATMHNKFRDHTDTQLIYEVSGEVPGEMEE